MSLLDNELIILSELRQAAEAIDQEEVDALTAAVLNANKVYFTGVGRVLLSLQAICKRFSHLGIDVHIVGDITEPAITSKDLLIVASGSGESIVPKVIAKKGKELGACMAWIGSNSESTIAQIADIKVRIPVQTKLMKPDEIHSAQPMTSLFEQSLLLFGDALAMEIIRQKRLDLPSLWSFHANLE